MHMTLAEMKALPKDKQEQLYKKINEVRSRGKTVNYSATYLVGAKKLSLTLDIPVKEAKVLLDAYWKRNWAIKAFAKGRKIQKLPNGELWVLNPMNGYWYSLRYQKDIFSTVNQSAGSWIFFSWIKKAMQKIGNILLTYHDEFVSEVLIGEEDKYEEIVHNALKEVNEALPLNVDFGCSVEIGNSYADIH